MSKYLLTRLSSLVKTNPEKHPDRRGAILRSAVSTLSKHGFRGATTRRLARDAGVSEALLYKHFRSKEDLLDAVLDHLVERFKGGSGERQLGDQDLSDRDFLARFARETLSLAERNPEEVRILFYAGLQGHRLAGEYFRRQANSLIETIVERIRRGQEQGRYRKVSATTAADCYLSMLRSQVLKLVIFGNVTHELTPLEEDSKWPELFAEIFLEGIS